MLKNITKDHKYYDDIVYYLANTIIEVNNRGLFEYPNSYKKYLSDVGFSDVSNMGIDAQADILRKEIKKIGINNVHNSIFVYPVYGIGYINGLIEGLSFKEKRETNKEVKEQLKLIKRIKCFFVNQKT